MIRKSLLVLALASAGTALAESPAEPKDAVTQLWGLPWHSTLRGTTDAASRAKGKYVLWLRLLGDLGGKS